MDMDIYTYIYYQTERIEQAEHVARYASVVEEIPVVDFIDEFCIVQKWENVA